VLGFETFKFYVLFNTSRVMSTTARARRNLRDSVTDKECFKRRRENQNYKIYEVMKPEPETRA